MGTNSFEERLFQLEQRCLAPNAYQAPRVVVPIRELTLLISAQPNRKELLYKGAKHPKLNRGRRGL